MTRRTYKRTITLPGGAPLERNEESIKNHLAAQKSEKDKADAKAAADKRAADEKKAAADKKGKAETNDNPSGKPTDTTGE